MEAHICSNGYIHKYRALLCSSHAPSFKALELEMSEREIDSRNALWCLEHLLDGATEEQKQRWKEIVDEPYG